MSGTETIPGYAVYLIINPLITSSVFRQAAFIHPSQSLRVSHACLKSFKRLPHIAASFTYHKGDSL